MIHAAPSRRLLLRGLAAAALVPLAACAAGRNAAAPAQTLEASQALLARYVADGKIAGGTITTLRRETAPITVAAGTMALGDPRPYAVDTVSRIYSMTKPVTAIAAMRLIEEGKLGLDQPIADFVPAFAAMQVLTAEGGTRPASGPITPRHLMTHTAGLTYHFNPGPLGPRYAAAGITPGLRGPLQPGHGAQPATLSEFGDRLAALPLNADPGARYEYSVGLDLLGLVIERAAGQPFEAVLRDRIFDPLGMRDTGFSTTPASRDRLAAMYLVTKKGLAPADPPATSPFHDASWMPAGGGGLVSTATDYARFCAMMLGDGAIGRTRILKTETMRLARSNLLPEGVLAEGGHFGAGMSVATPETAAARGTSPGTFGWGGAAGTLMWVDPVRGFSAILMVQHLPAEAYTLREDARTAVYQDLA